MLLVVVVFGRGPSAEPTLADAEFRGLGIWSSALHWYAFTHVL